MTGWPWQTLVNYEREVRREALNIMHSGHQFDVAMEGSWNDPIVKTRHFIELIQTRALKHRAENGYEQPFKRTRRSEEVDKWGAPPPPPPPFGGGKDRRGKGKGKGNQKGAKSMEGTTQGSGCSRVAPDGRQICFRYNNKREGCKDKTCTFAHVCGTCYKKGTPMFACDHQK